MSDFTLGVKRDSEKALWELLNQADINSGEIVVIGCSTSEVVGEKIGTGSSRETAESIYQGITSALIKYCDQTNRAPYLAFQCCEHLNRALLVSRACQKDYNLETVTVIPALKAGGSLPTVVYSQMEDPIMVEQISAHAGLDIGDTFIGMHLKHVAVPLRPDITSIGEARVTMARTRPKLIGGERAVYK